MTSERVSAAAVSRLLRAAGMDGFSAAQTDGVANRGPGRISQMREVAVTDHGGGLDFDSAERILLSRGYRVRRSGQSLLVRR